jgi:hypothetical protein
MSWLSNAFRSVARTAAPLVRQAAPIALAYLSGGSSLAMTAAASFATQQLGITPSPEQNALIENAAQNAGGGGWGPVRDASSNVLLNSLGIRGGFQPNPAFVDPIGEEPPIDDFSEEDF